MERLLEVAKQMFTMNNFSGGINSVKDARDISINEFAYLNGFMVDQDGALRPTITVITHDGQFSNTSIDITTGSVRNSGGNNLAYFESDIDLFFRGSSDSCTYATIANVAIDFYTGNVESAGVGETTILLTKPIR